MDYTCFIKYLYLVNTFRVQNKLCKFENCRHRVRHRMKEVYIIGMELDVRHHIKLYNRFKVERRTVHRDKFIIAHWSAHQQLISFPRALVVQPSTGRA